jgi:hypothetical protein
MNQNKKEIFKLWEMLFWMVIIYFIIYIFGYVRAKWWKYPFSSLITLTTGIYLPIFFLLWKFFYPLFIEKLNLNKSQHIIFEGIWRYITFWYPFTWISELSMLNKGLTFYIFSSLASSFILFCLEIIVAILRIKKLKE